jgi:hypothetical protein
VQNMSSIDCDFVREVHWCCFGQLTQMRHNIFRLQMLLFAC